MPQGRIKGLAGKPSVYHCMTRTVNGEFLLDGPAKELLRKHLWQAAEFSGVQILTYAILTNHFHVLVSVPDREQAENGSKRPTGVLIDEVKTGRVAPEALQHCDA